MQSNDMTLKFENGKFVLEATRCEEDTPTVFILEFM